MALGLIEDTFVRRKKLRVPVLGLGPGLEMLDPEASQYVSKVRRSIPGDELELFDPTSGVVALAIIERLNPRGVSISIQSLEVSVQESLPVTLAVCWGKGDKPEQALRDATVLGARRVFFVTSERVQQAKARSVDERHRRILIEAARQSGRNDLPILEGSVDFEQLLERTRAEQRLVFDFTEDAVSLRARLEQCPSHSSITLLIGPEGGLSSEELEQVRGAGFLPTSLGPLVLRTETAVTVALGSVRTFLSS